MLAIRCPWCGRRDEQEFIAGGEANIRRPQPTTSDGEWGEYLHFRGNVRGVQVERWFHAYGCRRWFNAVRDTVTHEIFRTDPIGALSGTSE